VEAPLRWDSITPFNWTKNWCYPFMGLSSVVFTANCPSAPTLTLLSKGPDGYVGWGGNLTARTVLLPNYPMLSVPSLANAYSCTQRPSRVLGVHVETTEAARSLAACDMFPTAVVKASAAYWFHADNTTKSGCIPSTGATVCKLSDIENATFPANVLERNVLLTQVPPPGMRFLNWECSSDCSTCPFPVRTPLTSSSSSLNYTLAAMGPGMPGRFGPVNYTCIAVYAYGCTSGLEWDIDSCKGEPVRGCAIPT
jgi:hypothetical protein